MSRVFPISQTMSQSQQTKVRAYRPPQRRADHPDTTSASEFPSLGPASAAAPKPQPLSFAKMAAAVVARTEAEERAAAAAAYRKEKDVAEAAWRGISCSKLVQLRRRLTAIPSHCYDDGPEDYDMPDEDAAELSKDDAYYDEMEAHEMAILMGKAHPFGDYGEPAADDVEINAHLGCDRRRGDYGVW